MFMQFDYVRYIGGKLDVGGKVGEIICKVKDSGHVVEFGNGSYIVKEENLVKHKFSDRDKVEVSRRRNNEDEE